MVRGNCSLRDLNHFRTRVDFYQRSILEPCPMYAGQYNSAEDGIFVEKRIFKLMDHDLVISKQSFGTFLEEDKNPHPGPYNKCHE